jgi:hypothetical protein
VIPVVIFPPSESKRSGNTPEHYRVDV